MWTASTSRSGVLDDGGHLRRRQTPIHRDVDRTDQRATEEEVEVRDAVAIEEGHPVSDADPVSPHGLGHSAGHGKLLSPRTALIALHQHLVVRLRRGQGSDQSGDGVAVLLGDDVRWHCRPSPGGSEAAPFGTGPYVAGLQ